MTRNAGTVRGARGVAESEDSLILSDGVDLASQLLNAGSRERAVHVAAERCHAFLRIPIACWVPPAEAHDVALAGFERERRAEVGASISALPALPSQAVGEVRRALEPVLDGPPVVLRAGPALLVAEGPIGDAGVALLGSVTRVLGRALETFEVVSEARTKSESLDLAIAWTAHELRGPLIAALAALDHAVAMEDSGASTDLLRGTREELEGLASLVDPLLRWAAGAGPLHPCGSDLVEVVRDAIAAPELGLGPERVALFAPDALRLRADPRLVRTALANLLRNAVAFSPAGEPVIVEVGSNRALAWVSIRDRGPGVPPEERDVIFEPFARGSAGSARGVHPSHPSQSSRASRPRGGVGLGLFIARRVAEAHGGTVRLLPTRSGAAFSFELPMDERGRVRSAS